MIFRHPSNYGEVCQRMAGVDQKEQKEMLIEAAAEDLARYLLLPIPDGQESDVRAGETGCAGAICI